MPFTIDFLDDGRVLEWEAADDGATVTERDDYTPRYHIASRSPTADIDLMALRTLYEGHPDVVETEVVSRRPGFRRDDECVLAVDVNHTDRVTSLAHQAHQGTPAVSVSNRRSRLLQRRLLAGVSLLSGE